MLTAMFSDFEGYLVGRDLAALTVRGYLDDLKHFAHWFEGANGEDLRSENLTPTDIRQYRQALQAAKAKPSTINRRLAALRVFGAALMSTGKAQDNPARQIRGVDQQKLAPKWLDKREQAAITRELELIERAAQTEAGNRQAVRDRAAVTLLLNTGLRVGELCALELGDLELSERKGSIRVRAGKGEKARLVPLNLAAREALRSWLELRREAGGKVFTGKRGEALTPSGLSRRLQLVGRRSGVEVTPHTLRHTFAKNLVDAGVSLEKVAMLMGHSSLNTTRIYTVPGERDLAAAVGLLDL